MSRENIQFIRRITPDILVRFCVFLFPVFAVSVRHWVSSIFVFLCVVSLVQYFRKNKAISPLNDKEKRLFIIMAAFFIVYLLSSAANNWGKSAYYALGTELRFLLFIPLYLLLRKVVGLWKDLALGCFFGVFVALVQALYDVYVPETGRAAGVYSPLFIGPVSVIFALFALSVHEELVLYYKKVLLIATFSATLAITNLAMARSALLAFLIVFLFIIISTKARWSLLLIRSSVVVVLITLVWVSSARMTTMLNNTLIDFDNYYQFFVNDPEKLNPHSVTSTGTHLEMLRSVKYFLQDSPVVGVGRFNYEVHIKEYIAQGKVHPAAAAGHPHNVFAEALVSKGLLGFAVVVLMFFYPLYIFIRDFRKSRTTARAGIVFITTILIVMQTEAAVIVKGNFVAVFLLLLAVIFSWHINSVKQLQTNPSR